MSWRHPDSGIVLPHFFVVRLDRSGCDAAVFTGRMELGETEFDFSTSCKLVMAMPDLSPHLDQAYFFKDRNQAERWARRMPVAGEEFALFTWCVRKNEDFEVGKDNFNLNVITGAMSLFQEWPHPKLGDAPLTRGERARSSEPSLSHEAEPK